MGKKEQLRNWITTVLKPWIKTPRGAFVAGLVIGSLFGRAVLSLVF